MSWLRRFWLLMLVLGTLVSPRLASAQAPLGLETRVGGLDLAVEVIVGVHDLASAGSYLGNPDGYDEDASGCSLAARAAAPELPAALRGGEATTHVYFGVRNGERVYAGITNNIARRQAEHGGRFVLEQITQSPVTRGEARAIEQALIQRNPGFENIRNSISPSHSWYGEAVEWGEAWLKAAGY